ncbi:hypothetical protein B0H13DRAFT_1896256 [Mycena leptocephala]|nr:hypothetical protein B0H13DRAFT_1896256 [Mycena leptocephala]
MRGRSRGLQKPHIVSTRLHQSEHADHLGDTRYNDRGKLTILYRSVWMQPSRDNMPYLAFVASGDIPAYTEITFDYNPALQEAWESRNICGFKAHPMHYSRADIELKVFQPCWRGCTTVWLICVSSVWCTGASKSQTPASSPLWVIAYGSAYTRNEAATNFRVFTKCVQDVVWIRAVVTSEAVVYNTI